MASGLEIFIIIFILLLVITGIILAIYFVWRNDQKKREGTKNGDGGDGGGDGDGNGGGTVKNFPKDKNFSIFSSSNSDLIAIPDQLNDTSNLFLYNQSTKIYPCELYYWIYTDKISIDGKQVKNAIRHFQDNGLIYPDPNQSLSYKVGDNTQTVQRLITVGNGETPPPDLINASWVFKGDKICLQNSPNKCMYSSPSDAKLLMVLADDTNDNGDKGFLWNTGTVATTGNSKCI